MSKRHRRIVKFLLRFGDSQQFSTTGHGITTLLAMESNFMEFSVLSCKQIIWWYFLLRKKIFEASRTLISTRARLIVRVFLRLSRSHKDYSRKESRIGFIPLSEFEPSPITKTSNFPYKFAT